MKPTTRRTDAAPLPSPCRSPPKDGGELAPGVMESAPCRLPTDQTAAATVFAFRARAGRAGNRTASQPAPTVMDNVLA